MRRKLSFKGIILGAVADVIGTNIWALAAAIYLSYQYHIYSLPQAEQSSQLLKLISQDPVINILTMLIGGGFSILGGYIAARIAKHNELLNGTLSSFLCVLSSFFVIGSYPALYFLLGILINPILGLIGGYLRLLQITKRR